MSNLLVVIISFFVMLALAAGFIYYLSKRCKLFFPNIPQKAFIGGFIAILVIIILNSTLFSIITHPVLIAIGVIGVIATSLLIFFLFSLVVIDVLNLIFKFNPKIRRLLSIGLGVLFAVYGLWNAHTVKVKEITIPIKGLTHEIRAVHISDVHLGNYWGKRQMDKIVGNIKTLNPDVIFHTGDLFDSKAHFGEGKDVLSAFRSLNVPHYFVNGNHDIIVGEQEVKNQLKKANATVLYNEIANFGELQIIGLNNMQSDENSFDPSTQSGTETIKSVLENMIIDNNRPSIVLHHRPDGMKYMHEKGIDLFLAGHTHAGQMFPFSLFLKINFGKFSYFKYETMDIHVSEGTGAVIPIRFGTNNIIALIRLVPKI